MTRHWSAGFVGIPYRDRGRERDTGLDCWGLVILAAREAAGILLPSYDGLYASSDERREIAAIVAREAESPVWQEVEGRPRAFDIAFFRRGRLDSHAGIVIERGLMLHMVEDDASKIERYDNGVWEHRLTGIYRYGLT